MHRAATLALLVAFVAASSAAYKPLLDGVVPCGSKGKVLEIRVTDCDVLPCDLRVGSTYTIEVDFIPVADHPFLTVLVSVITDGKETTIINTDVQTSVVAGNAYTVKYPLTVTGNLVARGTVALRIQVAQGGVTELCGLATANIKDVIF